MNELLEKAFEKLSISCNKPGLHTLDEDKIKLNLRVLHKNNVPINVVALELWLVEKGWQPSSIKSIISWAKSISNGGRVQIKHKEYAPSEKEIWDRINA